MMLPTLICPLNRLPEVGTPVACLIESHEGKLTGHTLIHVDEEDTTWRFAEDNVELNEWRATVIAWAETFRSTL